MLAEHSNPSDRSRHLSQYRPQQNTFEASYDSLIDNHPSPYSMNVQHQVHAAQPSPDEHRRALNPIQSYSSEYTSKASSETTNNTPRAYPPSPVIKDVEPRGFWQTILPESLACRLYVITVLIETTIDLAIEGDLLIRFHEADLGENQKMPVYLTVFAIAHVFQFAMALDAVYARNTLQFLFLTIFNALLLVFAVIQISEIRRSVSQIPSLGSDGISHVPVGVLTVTLPVVISIAEVAYIALGVKIYHEFGWKIYKFLGADRKIKKLYARYQIFQCLIKFDVFFWVGFSVQFISLVLLQKRDWEFYITCAALPVSLVLLVEGYLAARHENKAMMLTFMSGCVGALVYFIYKLFKVIKYRQVPPFLSISKSLATFSVISIVLLVATFVFAVILIRNFGRGLKESIDRNQNHHLKHLSLYGSEHGRTASKTLNRMSID